MWPLFIIILIILACASYIGHGVYVVFWRTNVGIIGDLKNNGQLT